MRRTPWLLAMLAASALNYEHTYVMIVKFHTGNWPRHSQKLLSCPPRSSLRRIFTIFPSEHLILEGSRFDEVAYATPKDFDPPLISQTPP